MKCCNICKYVHRSTMPFRKGLYTASCGASLVFGFKQSIAHRLKDGDIINTPSWCPLLKERKCKSFKDIKPIFSFDFIKEGCWYHVPPIDGKKRMDIFIEKKYASSIRYTQRGSIKCEYMQKTDNAIKFMSNVD